MDFYRYVASSVVIPSPEQARPYVEASERKLREVSFFELVLSQGRKSKNSNVNNLLSSCLKF